MTAFVARFGREDGVRGRGGKNQGRSEEVIRAAPIFFWGLLFLVLEAATSLAVDYAFFIGWLGKNFRTIW
jgi:hypothetical protein